MTKFLVIIALLLSVAVADARCGRFRVFHRRGSAQVTPYSAPGVSYSGPACVGGSCAVR